jgi:cysteine-rich repeat protein
MLDGIDSEAAAGHKCGFGRALSSTVAALLLMAACGGKVTWNEGSAGSNSGGSAGDGGSSEERALSMVECPDGRRVNVTGPACGDGRLDEGELCDDAGAGSCSADCQVPRCGDGQVQTERGEECDDGINDGGYGSCQPDCTFSRTSGAPDCLVVGSRCGDGFTDAFFGETCDDGINDGSDGRCNADCTSSRDGSCGDGVLQPLYEECDDGNIASCDGCSANCQRETEDL